MIKKITPQIGFQTKFLSCEADIAFGGWAAWAWKTFALLLEPLRHINNPWFWWVIFRRTTPQIRNEWWLWDTSIMLYPWIKWEPKESSLEWNFKSWAKIKFSHLEYEKDVLNWQWSQIPFIWFDELTHFSKKQFMYMLSRNRSTCWVKPYIRATMNPDSDSWVKEFISWYIDENWYIIKERDWIIRYFIQDWWNIIWWDSKEEVIKKCPHIFNNEKLKEYSTDDLILSFTFIEWDIYENQELLKINPAYLSNLLAQDEVIRNQLLFRNWNITQDWLAICIYDKIEDIFSNFVEKSNDKYITCDVARFGRDLAVIMTWEWYKVIRIDIFTKSTIPDL